MYGPEYLGDETYNPELTPLMQEMLNAQLALGKSIANTSQFLRFSLTVANENLYTIRAQLERIQALADAINEL